MNVMVSVIYVLEYLVLIFEVLLVLYRKLSRKIFQAHRPHSIILASCKPGFRPGLQPCFRQVRAGLRHDFDTLSTFFVENLVANLLHQSRHIEIDAAGSQHVRWFARVLDKWNVEKTRFKPANEPVEAGFSLRVSFFVHIMK